MRTCAAPLLFLVIVSVVGCVRREGRNSDCKWPDETADYSTGSWRLGADAEFAEELAVRYADAHYGPRTPDFVSFNRYAAARDRCMEGLLAQIAGEHSVPVERVSGAFGRNLAYIQAAESLSFVLVCCFAAIATARKILRRYPPAEQGWVPGALMVSFVSLVFAVGSTMLGELWSLTVESSRIGTGHMSYRAQRLWWGQHRILLFVALLVVFWLGAIHFARRMRPIGSPGSDQSS